MAVWRSPPTARGAAVRALLSGTGAKVRVLAVRRMPKSGKPDELMDFEEISAGAIVRTVAESLEPAKI